MKPDKHKQNIILGVCRRDYDLMETYHTDLLEDIELAIQEGVPVRQIRRWAKSRVNETDYLQRIENAAIYAEWLNGDVH